MVKARYVSPARGPRGALRFSFQDVLLLRTARALLEARIPARRVGSALRAIRPRLPVNPPETGLSITAAGDRIVVHEGGAKHDALTGQLLLALDVRTEGGTIRLVDRAAPDPAPPAADDCERQFEAALELEETDVEGAVQAYRACVARHAHNGALANLGRLLHLQGHISEAVELYRSAADPDVDVLYNLAVALDDLGRAREAIATYEQVLAVDPGFADAHHNLARLHQEAGEPKLALRHWNRYRQLTRSGEPGR